MATMYKRGQSYWAQVWRNGKRHRFSLETDNYGLARAKLRTVEFNMERHGLEPTTKTPVGELVQRFVQHRVAQARPKSKSVQTDCYRLQQFFGDVCPALAVSPSFRTGPGGPCLDRPVSGHIA